MTVWRLPCPVLDCCWVAEVAVCGAGPGLAQQLGMPAARVAQIATQTARDEASRALAAHLGGHDLDAFVDGLVALKHEIEGRGRP